MSVHVGSQVKRRGLLHWARLGLMGAAVAVALAGSAGTAVAAESPEVEAIIQRGIELRRSGNDETALAVFLQAEEKDPSSVRVLLHVATAAQASGKWLMANQYLKKVQAEHSRDRYYLRHRDAIAIVEQTVAQRIGRFRAVGEPDGAEVSLDGERVGLLPMNEATDVQAGTYTLEVTKGGYYRLRRSVSIPGGVLTREVVELNERPADSPALAASGGASPADFGTRQSWWREPWVTWTLGGLAVASAATAGSALLVREQRVETWNDDSRCLDPVNVDEPRAIECGAVRSDVDTAEAVAAIGGVAAATFGIAALTHWLFATGSDTTQDTASTRGTGCSPSLGAVVCYGSF